MSRNVTITLQSGAGASLGPSFNVSVSGGSILPTTATKSELFAGKVFSVSSNDEETITITSIGDCTNSATVTVPENVITSECYKLNSVPFGGCSIQYKNETGLTVTTNIPAQDEGLCYTICASEIISDSCGFFSVGVSCDDPDCACDPIAAPICTPFTVTEI